MWGYSPEDFWDIFDDGNGGFVNAEWVPVDEDWYEYYSVEDGVYVSPEVKASALRVLMAAWGSSANFSSLVPDEKVWYHPSDTIEEEEDDEWVVDNDWL